MANPELLVIGGGISGTSLAHFAASQGRRVLLLERGPTLGGCVQSHRLGGDSDGFWFELGAHTAYNSYGNFLVALEARGGLDRLIPRTKVPFRLLVDGRVTPITKQLHLFELLRSAPRLLWTRKEGRSVQEYYGRLVGKRNYTRVFGPVFAAVPSQPADAFPAEMLFKKRERRKEILRSFSMRGGLQSFIELLAQTPGIEARPNAQVVALERRAAGFAVRLANGETLEATSVALAVPPNMAAELAGPVIPALAAALDQIRVTRIKTVGAVLPRERAAVDPFAFIIPLDGRFCSIVSRDTVPDPKRRGFAMHMNPSVATDAALAQLAQVLGTDADKFEATVTREVTLPSPVVGHHRIVEAIDTALSGQPLLVAGNYFGGLALEDCVTRARAEAARLAAMAPVGS